jgi:hypothetical protein
MLPIYLQLKQGINCLMCLYVRVCEREREIDRPLQPRLSLC